MVGLVDLPSEVFFNLSRFLDLIGYTFLIRTGSSVLRIKLKQGGRDSLVLNETVPSGWFNSVLPLQNCFHAHCDCFPGFHSSESMVRVIEFLIPQHSLTWTTQMMQNSYLNLTTLSLVIGDIWQLMQELMEGEVVLNESMPNMTRLSLRELTSQSAHSQSNVPLQYFLATLPGQLVTLELDSEFGMFEIDMAQLVCEWPTSLKHLLLELVWCANPASGPSPWISELRELKECLGDRMRYDVRTEPNRSWNLSLPPSLATIRLSPEISFFDNLDLTPELAQTLPRHLTSLTYAASGSHYISSSSFPPDLTYLQVTSAEIVWVPNTLQNLKILYSRTMPTVHLPALEKLKCGAGFVPSSSPPYFPSLRDFTCWYNTIEYDNAMGEWLLNSRQWETITSFTCSQLCKVGSRIILPPNLTCLTVSQVEHLGSELFTVLPRSIQELKLNGVLSIDSSAFLDFFSTDPSKTPLQLHTIGIFSLNSPISDLEEKSEAPQEAKWIQSVLNALPPSMTRFEWEMWRSHSWKVKKRYAPIPDTLEWPSQLLHLSLPNDHFSIPTLIKLSCPNLLTFRAAAISIGSVDELLQLPKLLASSPFSALPLAHIPLWIPHSVCMSLNEIHQAGQVSPSSVLAHEEDNDDDSVEPPPSLVDRVVNDIIRSSPYFKDLYNIFEHFKIIAYPSIERSDVERHVKRGFAVIYPTEPKV